MENLRQTITIFLHKLIKSGQLDAQSADMARAYMAFVGITLYKEDKRWDTREKALEFMNKIKEPIYETEIGAMSEDDKEKLYWANHYAEPYDPDLNTEEKFLAFFVSNCIMVPVTDERYNTPVKAHIFLKINSIPCD